MRSERSDDGPTASPTSETKMIDGVEHTLDGRHIVVDGRRWRASDPSIPPTLRVELVAELMAARREVGAAKRAGDDARVTFARVRVGDAKVALGERGRAWWEAPEHGADMQRCEASIRTLLRHRAPESSICPSEVARIVRFDQWHDVLPIVRTAAAGMRTLDEIVVTRGDAPVESFDGGPVRLRRGPSFR